MAPKPNSNIIRPCFFFLISAYYWSRESNSLKLKKEPVIRIRLAQLGDIYVLNHSLNKKLFIPEYRNMLTCFEHFVLQSPEFVYYDDVGLKTI